LQEFPQSLGTGIHNAAPGKQSLSAQVRRSDTDGLELTFCWNRTDGTSITWDLHSPLVGLHNASNLLTVSGLALSLGFQPEDLQCFRTFMGVPGRLERISIPTAHTPNLTGTGIFVDYAHTPDALIRVLEALKHAGFRRIITVFGCGGDRDKTKRPIMGEAVASRSDITIVTSDNPRTENPEDIINDIMPGLRNAPSMYRESDRRKAIELAVNLLQPGDALLVAGKGHENYQIIGTEKQHFSDQEILKELISC
jgi:UDP-N-acetylmuramoyl-L-alanyl-D-glutamate--2,6-diaminopimelate ligase